MDKVLDPATIPDSGLDFARLTSLSDRQQNVLILLAQGKYNREIAEALGISTKTVDTHRLNILRKLNLRNNSDLTRFAIRCKLVTP